MMFGVHVTFETLFAFLHKLILVALMVIKRSLPILEMRNITVHKKDILILVKYVSNFDPCRTLCT